MKLKSVLLTGLFATRVSFAADSAREIEIHCAVQPNSVRWEAGHTSLAFMCRVVISNQTSSSLTVSNLFQDRGGLCMKVTDTNGIELARLIAPPFHWDTFTIGPRTNSVFWPYYGITSPFNPEKNKAVQLQLEGKLLGSTYTKPVTSDVVEMRIP